VFAALAGNATPASAVAELLAAEREAGMTTSGYYQGFAARVDRLCETLRTLLASIKADGSTIAAYGAAAKGATLCNYAGIGTETIDFVVDRNVHKQGRYMPGVHVPIVDPAALLAEINLVLAAGQLSAATLATLASALDSIAAGTDAGKLNRIYAALTLVLASPEYLVQK